MITQFIIFFSIKSRNISHNTEITIATTGSNTEILKKLAEDRMLLFDEQLMKFAMGNCITIEDTNGNRKLYKKSGIVEADKEVEE